MPGKQGAASVVAGLNGKKVRLNGALIYREEQVMIELRAGSIATLSNAAPPLMSLVPRPLSKVTMDGEIVSSKCFFGTMKPGSGKPHRACAVRCISGGIPPAFAVRNGEGDTRCFLLVSREGEPVNAQILDRIAEPIRITGTVVAYDNLNLLYADPATFERLRR